MSYGNGHEPDESFWNEPEPPPRVTGQILPAFGFYVVQPVGSPRVDVKEGKTPRARLGLKIVEGPVGTVGETVFDDLYLNTSLQKASDEVDGAGRPVMRDKTAVELATSSTYFTGVIKKIVRVFGFQIARPGHTQQSYEAFAAQFEGAPQAVVQINIESKGRTQPANRINWLGLRALTDPALSAKMQGKTALDEARSQIQAKAVQQGNAKAATKTTTAPSVVG